MQPLVATRSIFRSSRALSLRRAYSTSPSPPSKPYYITTPIFYPNAKPHIGHLHSLVIADIYARYAKLCDPDRAVHFVTGTDEHGLKIQNAAKAKGLSPLQFCDELSVNFRNLAKDANTTVSCFTRTTQLDHVAAVTHLWKELEAKGLIYKGEHSGWYSISDETFYPATQVTQLENGEHISTTSGSKVEWQTEVNYKFRLSAFRDSLRTHYTENPDVVFPPQAHQEVLAWLEGPLEGLSISRNRSRLTWGIPVPNDPEQTIYVWIDALTTYLSSVGYPWNAPNESSRPIWPPNVQVIGKDILRFHAIYFPAMLQALGLPLPINLLSHAHWTVDRAKMSKSVGNVADPVEFIQEHDSDIVRFYLARVGGRFRIDVDWSEPQLLKHRRELVTNFGNTYARLASPAMAERTDALRPADAASALRAAHPVLAEQLASLPEVFDTHMRGFGLADAVAAVVDALEQVNVMLTVVRPWDASVPAQDVADARWIGLEALRQCAILFQPIIPVHAEMLLDALGVHGGLRSLRDAGFGRPALGKTFPKLLLWENKKAKK